MLSAKGYAGFWKRLVAYIIDGLVVSGIVYVLNMFAGIDVNAPGMDRNVGLVSIAIAWLYFALQESSQQQATLGKLALGITVTNLQGQRISFGVATARHFAKILSGILLGIGYLMAAFTARKQALHDMIAGTLVVNK